MSKPDAKPEAPSNTYRAAVAHRVAARAQVLQREYNLDRSHAVAALAKLRHAYGRPPGADPNVWSETLAIMDEDAWRTDQPPTPDEIAGHTALTLFAIHQQSQRTARMHVPGVGLGRATARLVLARNGGTELDESDPTLRRFHALGTATAFAEINHHARGLILLMRAEAIGLDYGMLTDDLVSLQDPRQAPSVRLAWGRQYYRTDRSRRPATTEDSASPTPEGVTE